MSYCHNSSQEGGLSNVSFTFGTDHPYGVNPDRVATVMLAAAQQYLPLDVASTFALNVTNSGTGSGSVASSPAGISCGADCSETYASGTNVVLTAAALSGSSFTGWGGACSGTATTCNVSMNDAKSVSAIFAAAAANRLITLTKAGAGTGTVTSSPSGISCAASCGTALASFLSTSSVTLVAAPATGSTFGGWSGVCSGTGNCSVAAGTGSASVAATFNTAGTGSSVTVLANAVPVTNLSGAVNSSRMFSIAVPSGASNLLIKTSGGMGDVDMYTRTGQFPTVAVNDCQSELVGNTESCGSKNPVAGTHYVLLNGYSAYSGVTLAASYTVASNATSITGTPGDDMLANGAGNNLVDGLAGVDTYVSAGPVSQYALSRGNRTWTLTDNSGASGSDTLSNVERLRFSAGLLLLDIDKGQVGGTAYRIYKAAFNRQPDNGGLKYWVGRMDAGTNVTDVAAGFIASAEFTALYGSSPSDGDYISLLYANVLGRAPDAGGYDYWVGELRAGSRTRQQVLAGFSESDENVVNVAANIANGIYLFD
jgi:hypothetical protein